MNYTVAIIDLNKLKGREWDRFFRLAGVSIHKIKREETIDKITDAIEKIQLEEQRGGI
jgi:hypothetical protein